MAEYAYIYNNIPQTVEVEADVIFNSHGPVTSNIFHTLNTTGIQLFAGGIYDIMFSVTGLEPNQYCICVNNVPDVSTIYGTAAGTQQNVGHCIMSINSGDIISLRNHTSFVATHLLSVSGGTQTMVNASIVIKKLDNILLP